MITINREDKIKIITMRIDGYSLETIAKEMHITRQSVSQILSNLSGVRGIRNKTIKYPYIKEFMLINDISLKELSFIINEPKDHLCDVLQGKSPMSDFLAEKISDYTEISKQKVISHEKCEADNMKAIPAFIVYPYISDWLNKNLISVRKLAKLINCDYKNVLNTLKDNDKVNNQMKNIIHKKISGFLHENEEKVFLKKIA